MIFISADKIEHIEHIKTFNIDTKNSVMEGSHYDVVLSKINDGEYWEVAHEIDGVIESAEYSRTEKEAREYIREKITGE